MTLGAVDTATAYLTHGTGDFMSAVHVFRTPKSLTFYLLRDGFISGLGSLSFNLIEPVIQRFVHKTFFHGLETGVPAIQD